MDDLGAGYPKSALDAAGRLIDQGREPILVFTESRREASQYAETFGRSRQKHASGIGIAEQLELFSEPTEASTRLQSSAERRIAFHTADLSPQEREVIERGFLSNEFDVCFATSTLAAGVNFPFRTVVFPKLTYQYGERQGQRIQRADYRNMSGRAGRLGMHESGYAVLLAKDPAENSHANTIVLPENDRIRSQLSRLTMRKAVLTLVASGGVQTKKALRDFFENTYFWFQLLDRNPAKLKEVLSSAKLALDWLVEGGFVEKGEDGYVVTPFGQATARSGLHPTTARAFKELLGEWGVELDERFDDLVDGLIHWICCSDEFVGEKPSRFLPFPLGGESPGSSTYVAGKELLCFLDRSDWQLCQSVHALLLFVEGVEERIIFRRTNMTSGSVYRLANDVGWMLDGLRTIAAVPDISCSQAVGNSLGALSRRVRWGSPLEILDVVRVAQRARVPGFGRQRAMELVRRGVSTFEEIVGLGADNLTKIVKDRQRAEALLEAVDQEVSIAPSRFSSVHGKLGELLGVGDIVNECGSSLDKEYEQAIESLLRLENSWKVTLRDDGRKKK